MSPTAEAPKKTRKKSTRKFQAETRQLLDIVIHSLYSNKEIFLRELISNASDALDRLRFEALTDPKLMKDGEKLEIRLETDPEARTLTVSDNGIGMSRDEVIANIGTIAKSGTRELVQQIKEGELSAEALEKLIGQFGVGFYSAFMVADKVTLVTRRAGEETATRWESTGDGRYTLEDADRFMRGTSITLHLKPVDRDNGIEDYTDTDVLRDVVKRHSDFVNYPVIAQVSTDKTERDEDGNPIPGKTHTVVEEKTLNSMKPIWTRPESEVAESEYAEFYKHVSKDWSDPLDHLQLRAEGRLEYRALLFIPERAPFDIYYRDQKYGLQLYVRRVLIMDHCEQLLPTYLRFLKGVVDSDDLPLNISREMIQHDRHITQMRKWLTRKVLDHLKTMLEEDRDKYLKFWTAFGQVLKEGSSADFDNRERLIPLYLFPSTADPEKLTTLAEYVERMPEDQKEIYYLTAESRTVAESSPHLEAFKDKGYEVLFLVDPVDEIVAPALDEFDGKQIKSIGRGTVELGSDEEREQSKKALEEKAETHKALLEALQKRLDDWVKEVRLSNRLRTSPVCLVAGEHDLSPQLERMMRESEGMPGFPRQKRIMELNPEHDVLAKLQTRFEADENDPLLDDYAQLLLGYAYLAEGSPLPDPAKYNKLVGELMVKGL